ncbi:MAG: helix-hairpin-helix domain-containing protein, partial [Erysipelotrichaceae bacterium]|nr:helix-hairpin-helix domain-containing protein [Erysipelotrichaceae bacterium]
VGQYQHDLPAKQLNERLDFAILKSVNRVGVDVNTASMELLMHVAGLNKANAKAIVEYRNEHGRFLNREQLKKVKKMGEKTYIQCAGFLRIQDGNNELDKTGIHPESYALANALLTKYDITQNDLDITRCAQELGSDVYTIKDIVTILKAPGRDYRERFDGPILRSDILEIEDLKIGDKLQGVVRNVTDFGAFIDIGLHEDGLAHISRLSKNRVNHPSEVVSVNDIVDVYVADIDKEREKVQLSLIKI